MRTSVAPMCLCEGYECHVIEVMQRTPSLEGIALASANDFAALKI
jgi:hypothetical protein